MRYCRFQLLIFAAYLTCPYHTLGTLSAAELRGIWQTLPSLPVARQEVGVAALGDRVYVIGGLTFTGGSSRVDIFDTTTSVWMEGPPLPQPLHHVAAAALNGRVYSIGGFAGSSFDPVDSVLELDPQTNTWRSRAPLPTRRGALAAAVIGNLIYAVGGTSPAGDSAELTVFDPQTNAWSRLRDMPTARNHLAAAAGEGRLFAVGGRSPSRATLEVFDPESGLWDIRTPMPTPRSGLAAAFVEGLLFVFGGEIPGVFEENEVYDPAGDRWFALTPMPVPRHGIGAAVVGNRIIVPGGGTVAGIEPAAVADQFLILPQILALAQYADGRDITSELLITNFGSEQNHVVVEFHGNDGSELQAQLDAGNGSRLERLLQAGTAISLSSTGGQDPPQVGAAILFSERPLLGHILFTSSAGFAGVLARPPTRDFVVPLRRDAARGSNSGIALASTSSRSSRVTLILRSEEGAQLASTELELPGFGHIALLIDELFPDLDQESFRAILSGSSTGDFSAMAILLRGNEMATLPVENTSPSPSVAAAAIDR